MALAVCVALGSASGAAQTPRPTCFGAAATIVGTAARERIMGTGEADVIVGLGGRDLIFGLGGADRICGGADRDTLLGNDGDDRMDGGADDDSLSGGLGNDEYVGGSGAQDVALFDTLADVVVNLAMGRASGHGDDVVRGIEVIWCAFGNDTVIGDGGRNLLAGGRGNDVIDGGAGDDELFGEEGDDTLNGGSGTDLAWMNSADTPVRASLVTGTSTGDGADTFVAIEGLVGSSLNDVLVGDARDNTLLGLGRDDVLDGGGGDDHLVGQLGNDRLVGGAGDDRLFGGWGLSVRRFRGVPPGNDVLVGGSGFDFLGGGEGPANRLDGGPDVDYCIRGRTTRRCEIAGVPQLPGVADRPPTRVVSAAAARTAEFDYGAEPVCFPSRVTEVAPPERVNPVLGGDEEAWWQGTLFRYDASARTYRVYRKTPWARAQVSGGFVVGGIATWRTATRTRSFPAPIRIRVPRGRYVWKGQIYWVSSRGRVFAAIEPHIIRGRTTRHDKHCEFR